MTERISDAEYAEALEWAKAVLSVLNEVPPITLANVSVKVRAVDEITHARALLQADQDARRYRAWRKFCVDNQNAREGDASDTYEGHDMMVDNVLRAQDAAQAAIDGAAMKEQP